MLCCSMLTKLRPTEARKLKVLSQALFDKPLPQGIVDGCCFDNSSRTSPLDMNPNLDIKRALHLQTSDLDYQQAL